MDQASNDFDMIFGGPNTLLTTKVNRVFSVSNQDNTEASMVFTKEYNVNQKYICAARAARMYTK